MKTKIKNILFIVLGIVLLDQFIKYEIATRFSIGQSYIIIKNFFRIKYIQNTGAAFGILEGNILFLISISIVILGYLIYEMLKENDHTIIICYGMVIGGLIGNLIDRIFLGYVRDFISFKIFGYPFAIFNISDIFLVVGVILLVILLIMEEYRGNKNKRK